MEKIVEKRFNAEVGPRRLTLLTEIHMPEKDNPFWTRFLPEIKKTIDSTLAALTTREQVLDSLSEMPVATYPARLEAMRPRLEGCAGRPEENLAAADALLQETEAEYRAKLAGIEALRQKLADWAGRAIR